MKKPKSGRRQDSLMLCEDLHTRENELGFHCELLPGGLWQRRNGANALWYETLCFYHRNQQIPVFVCVCVCRRLPGESDQELVCNQSVCLLLTNPDQPVQLDWAQLSWFHTHECGRKVCLEFKYTKVIRPPPHRAPTQMAPDVAGTARSSTWQRSFISTHTDTQTRINTIASQPSTHLLSWLYLDAGEHTLV